MNLNEMSFKNEVGENPPECVLREPLEKHLPNVNEFSHAVLALTFDSGPAQNKTARSYVFYFYKEEINPERRPDDILTFKIKFMDPHNIHIVDKYLGGMSFGALNAPALSYRHLWQPGMMSKEGKEKSFGGSAFPDARAREKIVSRVHKFINRREKKMLTKKIQLVCISFVILLLISCGSSPEKDYAKAKKNKSIELYQNFIQKYPTDSLITTAKQELYVLEFIETKKTRDLKNIELFLQKYPEGDSTAVANILIIELKLDEAINKNTLEAIDEFIKEFPDSKFIEQANQRKEYLTFIKAKEENTYEAFQAYINKFPKGDSIEVAKQNIKIFKAEYDEYNKQNEENTVKGTIKALENYLAKYPNGKYSDKARSDILEMRQINNHVVISAVFNDHRRARNSFTAVLNQMDETVVPTNLFIALWLKLNYWKNKEFKCYVSGIANNHLKNIFKDIPNKYIWIHMIIDTYDNSTSLTVQTPGTNTSWTDKELSFYIADANTINNLPLPKFNLFQKFDNSKIDKKMLQNNFIGFLENIKYSESLEYTDKILEDRKKAENYAEKGQFDLAIKTANEISNEGDKAFTLAKIAAKMKSAGKINESESVFNTSLNIAYSMKTPREKVMLMSFITTVLVEAKNKSLAEKTITDATNIVNTITNTSEKKLMMEFIETAKKDL